MKGATMGEDNKSGLWNVIRIDDDHNSDRTCTDCHSHLDGFARASPQPVTLTANSCKLN